MATLWQVTICDALNAMRKDGTLCDTTIVGVDGVTLYAHACVLTAASPSIATYFRRNADGRCYLSIDWITGQAWERLLGLMYCGTIDVNCDEEIHEVCALAKSLGVGTLVTDTTQHHAKIGLAKRSRCSVEADNGPAHFDASRDPDITFEIAKQELLPFEMKRCDGTPQGVATSHYPENTITSGGKLTNLHYGYLNEYMPQYETTHSGPAALDLSRATLGSIMETTDTFDHIKQDKTNYSGIAHSHLPSFRPTHKVYHETARECENTHMPLTSHMLRQTASHGVHTLWANACNVATEQRQYHSYTATKSLAPYEIISATDTPKNKVLAPWSADYIRSPIEVCTARTPSAHIPVNPIGPSLPLEDGSTVGETICEGMCQKDSSDKCGKTFTTRTSLSHRRSVHTSRTSYNCSHCPKQFTRVGNMQRHLRIHSSVKPFKCSVCDQVFPQKVQLARHRASHTDSRPYSCDTCHQRFTWKSSLNSHLLTHAGNKPHACTMCSSTFRMAYSLRRHMTTHMGERAYVCDLCGLAFNQSSNMASHRKTHTNARPHRCADCGNCFIRKYHLRRHREIHTKEHI